ncbi:MAG: O-antigen ligase family protein [Halothiobacillaceae bacterium]|nr:MAG: O-antigen ligase family protein [Halothiobacillaceae bacterium]
MNQFAALRGRIPLINSWLLAGLFFTIPTHVTPAYIISAFILLLWLIEGRFKEKLSALGQHPVFWIFWGYFLIFPISLLWSDNLDWGLKMSGKGLFFLLFPLYLSVARREHVRLYITAFIAAVTISEMLAYYNWLQLHYLPDLPAGIRNSQETWEIAPFVNHVMYNPILAFGAYLLGHALLFERLSPLKRFAFAGFLVTMTVNMFISGGRAGQIAFLAMMALLILQRFSRRPILAGAVALSLTAGLFMTAYQASDLFKHRVDLAVHEVQNYEQAVNSSVGLRINFTINTWRMIKEYPLLGVGVGDYPAEYRRINTTHSPAWLSTVNPHNQYLLVLATTGLFGLTFLVALLLYPLHAARHARDNLAHIRVALVALFMVIMLSESYLWRSNTSLMYVLFSAALYAYMKRSPVPPNPSSKEIAS